VHHAIKRKGKEGKGRKWKGNGKEGKVSHKVTKGLYFSYIWGADHLGPISTGTEIDRVEGPNNERKEMIAQHLHDMILYIPQRSYNQTPQAGHLNHCLLPSHPTTRQPSHINGHQIVQLVVANGSQRRGMRNKLN